MIKVTWEKGLQFKARDDHGHSIIVDTDTKDGGLDQGFRPAELLLVALAGCMSMDIISIVQKKGGRIESFAVNVQGRRAEKHPKRYERIEVEFNCEGDYKREDLVRAFELSRDKYCGVFATLQNPPEIALKI